MLEIKIPNIFVAERKYVLSVLFGEILFIDYFVTIVDGSDVIVVLSNGNELIISDTFFSTFKEKEGFLDKDNIPKSISYCYSSLCFEKDLVVLFGGENITINKDSIYCEPDLIAASFFMLTRWEEFVIKKKDHHGRFLETEALSIKFNFIDRPIVNEYAELIWNMLVEMGYDKKREVKKFAFYNTHDVDLPFLWNKYNGSIFRKLAGSLMKRKSISEALFYLKNIGSRFGNYRKDPFYTFDYLLNLSEKNNVKSLFFFIAGGETKHDKLYDIDDSRILELISEIQERGHKIGLHPSYNTYNNLELLSQQKSKLEELSKQEISFGRQHILRFDIPTTWSFWDQLGFQWDSTLSYPSFSGFRCGICQAYSVFNILSRERLAIKELPLTLMEVSLVSRQKLTPTEMEKKALGLMDVVKKYRGDFVLLWHNSSFNTPVWKPYQIVYERIIEKSNE